MAGESIISGTAMAVLAGVVFVIAPWLSPLVIATKILLVLFGFALILGGLYFSRG